MNDQQFVIDLGTDGSATLEPDQAKWLDEKLRRGQGPTRIRVRQDDSDTEGHLALRATTVRVLAEDDDDTEGHAISIHFPSAAEADAFRKRLMLTGVLVGTVALGSAGAVGLNAIQSGDSTGAATGAAAATLTGPLDVHEAPAFAAGAAATQAGPMDVHEAPAFQAGAGALTGPLDAHEAPAFQGDAATMTGPLDAHEAPAFQADSTTLTGPLDAHEAPAFQGSDGESDEADGAPGLGGPHPR